jgi:BMFP domain-containing protein YqiC
MLRDLDIVRREEFEAVAAMAQKAREENDRLSRRVDELESLLAEFEVETVVPRPVKRRKVKPSY